MRTVSCALDPRDFPSADTSRTVSHRPDNVDPGRSPIDQITSQISCRYFSRAESKSVLIADAKNTLVDFHGDHTSKCTSHSGATKAHDWMVSALDPLLRTAGHTVRTQHGVTETARRRGDSPLPARPGWQPEPGLRPQHHQKNISNTLATH